MSLKRTLTVEGIEAAIKRARPGERIELQDEIAPRLRVRITRSGATFSVVQQRRIGGREGKKGTNRQSLKGRFAREASKGTTLEAARRQANSFAVQVDHGIAPINVREQPAPKRGAEAPAHHVAALKPGAKAPATIDDLGPFFPGTFGALAADWVAFALPKLRRQRDYLSKLRHYLMPYWKDVPVRSHLTRELIVARLDAVAKWGSDSEHMREMREEGKRHDAAPACTQADRLGALISTMCSFAVKRGGWFAPGQVAHPAYNLPRYALSPKKKLELALAADDDYLDEPEIVRFWYACAAEQQAPLVALALWAEILTGQRGQEVLGMAWPELKVEKVRDEPGVMQEWWTIPGARSKNHLPNRVPVMPMLGALLAAIRATSPNKTYVFPHFGRRNVRLAEGASPMATAGPLNHETSSYRNAKARIFKRAGIAKRPHDFRRTLSTHLAALEVSEEIRDAILNQNQTSTVGRVHYNRHKFDKQKRAALALWDEELRRMLRAASVKPAASASSAALQASGAVGRLLPFPAGRLIA